MVSRREDCSKILIELLKFMTQEEVAVKLGVRANTVYYWKEQKSRPSMLHAKAIKKMLQEKKG